MARSAYEVSERFNSILFRPERGIEPLLIADQYSSGSTCRLFLVRYVIGEGAGGESKRPVFKNELTGYDHESKLTYPTQEKHLEELQSIIESHMYAPTEAKLSRIVVRNLSTGAERPVKAIISEELLSRLVNLYEYAW